jgi:thioester reductase-like protein
MQTLFFTGFPGFLGSELIQALLPKLTDAKALCLVQSKYKAQAEQARAALVQKNPLLQNRIEFIEGDITRPNLGIRDPAFDRNSITQFFHLAAVYDLSVKKKVAQKINVEGTVHTLQFAQSLPNLKRYQYVSTCYVSGRYAGTFHETDLEVGQTFNNYYEETKFLAELEVHKYMKQGLPATIYRPAVVVGNSETGETQKFDGPYFVIQWLLRQPKGFALLPTIGNPDLHSLNVVPSDFVVRAMTYLSQQESSLGKTFNLADPKPLTIRELVKNLGEATERHVISLPLTLGLAKITLRIIPGLVSFMRIPISTLNYFVHPTHYGTSLTQKALAEGGIQIPEFKNYSQKLVNFMKNHPSIRSQAMI